MAGLFDKWKLTETENIEKFLSSIGYSDDFVTQCMVFNTGNVINQYKLEKDYVTELVYSEGKEIMSHGFTLGKERQLDLFGSTAKLTSTVNDIKNQMETTQRMENGCRATYVTVVTGDKLEETMTSYDADDKVLVVAKRCGDRMKDATIKVL